ncbi:MAG: winged helix-turn-helix domain-containing protein [Candidatus Micrarchaeota archaeon]
MREPDNILWYLVMGTRGGPVRLQMLALLDSRPYNANQLASLMKLDYKTVRHHLGVLLENGLVRVSSEKRYGELYHITDYARESLKAFGKVLEGLK